MMQLTCLDDTNLIKTIFYNNLTVSTSCLKNSLQEFTLGRNSGACNVDSLNYSQRYYLSHTHIFLFGTKDRTSLRH